MWKDKFPKDNIYFETNNGILYCANVFDILPKFPNESIDCVVTSPPYWSLRYYGVKEQIGLELTFQEYLEKLWKIFDEIYRILKPTGTLWVNLGDTYSGSGKGAGYNGKSKESWRFKKKPKIKEKLPAKCLCLIPARFAIGMIDRGWILRNEIIWYKPNAMPESVKDRFTVDFEKIFLFVKKRRYYFKQILEPYASKPKTEKRKHKYRDAGLISYREVLNFYTKGGRNKRAVWVINNKPCKEAHFAVFPPEIPEICIMAGCPENGIVLDIFMGSGTTAVIAENLKRRWIGIEINQEYCEIAQNRILKDCYNA